MGGGLPRLRVRGLPYHVTTREVLTFFDGFNLVSGSPRGAAVELLQGVGRRPSGQAVAYFDDAEEAVRAKDALHGQPFCVIGSRVYRAEVLEDFVGRAIVT